MVTNKQKNGKKKVLSYNKNILFHIKVARILEWQFSTLTRNM